MGAAGGGGAVAETFVQAQGAGGVGGVDTQARGPPRDLTFPTALIDAADLAAFGLDCAERRIDGVFEELEAAGIGAWMGTPSLPLWIDDPEWRWFATLDTTAAWSRGLTTRPLTETLAAALAYGEQRAEPRGTGLTDGETNVTVPRSMRPEDVSELQAFELLAQKRAEGPKKKPTRKSSGTTRKAAAKKPAAGTARTVKAGSRKKK